jgi:WD40 repeat protein
VAFSPDGKTFVTASGQTTQLWETSTGKALGQPMQHGGMILRVCFSPDSKMILTGGTMDKTARFWDARTGEPLGAPLQHEGIVLAVGFSPDGKTALTASGRAVYVWEVGTGRPLGAAFEHQDQVHAIAFSPDGRTVLSGSSDKTARLWTAPKPIAGELQQILLWIEVITGMELTDSGIMRPLDATDWQERCQHLVELGGAPE